MSFFRHYVTHLTREEYFKLKSIDDAVLQCALQEIMAEPLSYSSYIFGLLALDVKNSLSLFIFSHLLDKDLLKKNKFLNKKEKSLLIRCIDLFHFLYFLEFKKEIEDYYDVFDIRAVMKYQDILSGETVDGLKIYLEKYSKEPKYNYTQLDFSKFLNYEEVMRTLESDQLGQKKICRYSSINEESFAKKKLKKIE